MGIPLLYTYGGLEVENVKILQSQKDNGPKRDQIMKLKTCLLLIFLTAGLYLVSNPRMAAKSLPVVTGASATDIAPIPAFSPIYKGDGWATAKWTGDNEPFASARRKIDALVSSKLNVLPIIVQFKKTAEANPTNALDQFQWVYAKIAWDAVRNDQTEDAAWGDFAGSLRRANQPPCYDYLRLLYITESTGSKSLGLRLLQRDPNDRMVLETEAVVLAGYNDNVDFASALGICQKLISSKEDVPTCYFVLGEVYASFTDTTPGCVERGREANASLDRFVGLAKLDDRRRARALKLEEIINVYLARHAQQ